MRDRGRVGNPTYLPCPVVNGSQLRLCLHFISITAQPLLDVGQLVRTDHKGVVSEELDNELQGWLNLGEGERRRGGEER